MHRTEALPALYLTCKALEHITFDRFAQTFEIVRCCIFYEERWPSLKKLLEKPSHISRRVRWVEFTTCFFEGVDFHEMPLAHNHDAVFLPIALNDAYKTYAETQAAEVQGPINVALFSCLLLDLKRVFPHIGISCRMSDNQGEGFEHLRAQLDILLTMIISNHKIRNLSLSHSSISTLDNIAEHLRPELLQSASKLERFEFVPTRGSEDLVTRRDTTANELKIRLMYMVLQSAEKLWSLELSLRKFILLNRATGIIALALDATVSNNIWRFVLRSTKVGERTLLKALSRWTPKLVELELGDVRLTYVHEGWTPILQLIATMLKLEFLTLWEMAEIRNTKSPGTVVISMNHLEKGSKTSMVARTLTCLQESDRSGRYYSDRGEVSLGLQELLVGHLRYQDA